jgi:PrsW family intramembrane metalloprotease
MISENIAPNLQPAEPQRRPPLDTASAWQFGLSLLAALILWGLALSMLAIGLFQHFNPTNAALGDTPYFLMTAGTALGGCLMLPSAAYALLHLMGRPAPANLLLHGALLPIVALLGLVLALLLGNWVSANGGLSWLLLPPLHILAVGLPVFLLVYLAVRDIPLGSPQRVWGVFAVGTFLGPLIIFFLETLAVILAIAGLITWISTQPALLNQITDLARQFQGTRPTPEEIQRLVMPLLANPLTLFLVFLFASVIVPLIEEALKPIGVWLLIGKNLTPAAGFTAGIISGAGYALVESLAIASGGDGWVGLVIARMGTAIIHILTTGMIGWALALAWEQGRYLRLGGTYLGNVFIHGLWNGLTLLIAFSAIPEVRVLLPIPNVLETVANLAPYGLVVLAGMGFIGLIVANRSLYWSQIPKPAVDTSVV